GEGEAGAYSICFHPQYALNHKFYIFYYKNNAAWAASLPIPNPAPAGLDPSPTPFRGEDDFGNPAGDLVLDEYQVDANDVSKVTRVRTGVFVYHHQPSIGQGNAKFGPDGYLYLIISDFDEGGRDLHTVARKVLRIDVTTPPPTGATYVIPPDNPYANDPDTAVKKEIWAMGFRGPWSSAFDWDTGDLWLGDVDQSTYEEINLITKKGNYGWDKGGDLGVNGNQGNSFSGPCASAAAPNIKPSDCTPFTDPSFSFPRSGTLGMTCVIVGTVFRGAQSSPFYGSLISADNSSNKIIATKKGAAAQMVGSASVQFGAAGHRGIASMASGAGGVVYVTATDWFDPANRKYKGPSISYEIYRLTSPDLVLKPFTEVTAIEKQNWARMNPSRPRLVVNLGFSPVKTVAGTAYDLSGKLTQGRRGAGIYYLKSQPKHPASTSDSSAPK
ncbi:MAG: PQQ-dependent sugar dehydrogenase, partial [Fibrobacteria bacterium]